MKTRLQIQKRPKKSWYLLIAVHQYDAEGRGYEASPAADRHVVALAYVVDVDRDAGVGADPVLLHQRD